MGEARAGGEPTGGDVGPLTVGESEPPAAGEVGGEKSGDEAGELPDLGSDTIDIWLLSWKSMWLTFCAKC